MRTNPLFELPRATSTPIGLVSVLVALGGCSFLDMQLQRMHVPDGRITLGWQERVQVHPRDLQRYTCEERYLLRCDGPGAITLSCTCSLR